MSQLLSCYSYLLYSSVFILHHDIAKNLDTNTGKQVFTNESIVHTLGEQGSTGVRLKSAYYYTAGT